MWTIGIYAADTEELTAMVSYGPEMTLPVIEELKAREAAAMGDVAHVYLVHAEIPPLTAREALAAEWKWRNRRSRIGLEGLKYQRRLTDDLRSEFGVN